jgi:hypothetical protein
MKAERFLPSKPISSWLETNPDRLIYENLSFTLSGNLTARGNNTDLVSIFKTSGSFAWDNHAYTAQGYTAPLTLEFNKNAAFFDNGRSYAMIGFNADPTTNTSYDTLDYCAYPYRYDSYSVHHNGANPHNGTQWNPNTKFYLVYDGTNIKHYNGSTLLYTSPSYTVGTVYIDSSFYAPTANFGGFSNIRLTKNLWNGTSY